MKVAYQSIVLVGFVFAAAILVASAKSQTAMAATHEVTMTQPSFQSRTDATSKESSALPSNSALSLLDFRDSDVKFSLQSLMKSLRDGRHEGWVLAAYPDPKTSRPLIGAGFSLDVEELDHLQRDPLNPNQFLEPSSADLWQAAGLTSARLQSILEQFDRNLQRWKKKSYRRKIKAHTLVPQISEEEAMGLLRISALQAIHNARAYCRDFDRLTAAQQMALSQLVFQMGVNLEEFVQFLSALNHDAALQNAALQESTESEREHWKTVQQTLMESQWARRYTTRAVTVIAMFDPDYLEDPKGAQRRVEAVLRPPSKHHHKKKSHGDSVRARNDTGAIAKAAQKSTAVSQ